MKNLVKRNRIRHRIHYIRLHSRVISIESSRYSKLICFHSYRKNIGRENWLKEQDELNDKLQGTCYNKTNEHTHDISAAELNVIDKMRNKKGIDFDIDFVAVYIGEQKMLIGMFSNLCSPLQ